jgi:hypothetical protein
MKVYVCDWSTYGLIEFMDVVQNIVLKIVIKHVNSCRAIGDKPPQEGRYQIQFPVMFLGNFQATFPFCPHSVVLEFIQPIKNDYQ